MDARISRRVQNTKNIASKIRFVDNLKIIFSGVFVHASEISILRSTR